MLATWMRGAALRLAVELKARSPQSGAPTTPVSRLDEPWWADRLTAKRAALRRPGIGMLMLGDSLTHDLDVPDEAHAAHRVVWDRFYAPYGAVNLGYAGDTTDNVLWRVQNGELDGVDPDAVMLLIGANDMLVRGRPAPVVAAGIEMILAEIAMRLPRAGVLVLGLLPSKVTRRVSRESAAVNARLAARAGREHYHDSGAALMTDGRIESGLFADAHGMPPVPVLLHPTAEGHARLALDIAPVLARVVQGGADGGGRVMTTA